MPALKPLLLDDFLDWDSGDEQRWELIAGVPVAMAAPSAAHQIIATNFARRLAEALDERPSCSARTEAPIAIVDRDDTRSPAPWRSAPSPREHRLRPAALSDLCQDQPH